MAETLSPDAPGADAPARDMAAALASCGTTLTRQALRLVAPEAALRRCDPEVVHDLRVATRRLRASLRLYRDLLRKRDRCRLVRPLRRLTRLLGGLRQAAVGRALLAELGPDLPPSLLPACRRCLEVLDLRLARHCVLVCRRLDGRRLRRLREAVFAVAGPLLVGTEGAASADQRLKAWVLPRLQVEVAAWRAALPGRAAPLETWHRFRVASKRLRYALEAGAPADEEGFGPALVALRELQEVLGRQHDHVALAADLEDVVRSLARLGATAELTGARQLAALVRARGAAIDAVPTMDAASAALVRTAALT